MHMHFNICCGSHAIYKAQGSRLARLEPKTRNLALLRSTWLQNFYLAFWLFCNFFVAQIFLEELQVACAACPCHHKTRSGHHAVVQSANKHPDITIKG